ncbi:uncharacterized protein LOC122630069 [Vespula pensylvanica]|uniref:uncharacterized protein LOC122630069 n=1 Tax=Vespula pensylvanica TaxID=30213 RepID=UPI001CBA39E7|nr:uncharacterized protein LOC122630069 [Vespula pensylvanica]
MRIPLASYAQTEHQNYPIGFGAPDNIQISLANGNIMKIPLASINISEEVNKSGIWQQVNESNEKQKQPKLMNVSKSKKHLKKEGSLLVDETTRLTTMTEEDEDDNGISIKVDLIRSKESIGPLKVNGTTSAETSV